MSGSRMNIQGKTTEGRKEISDRIEILWTRSAQNKITWKKNREGICSKMGGIMVYWNRTNVIIELYSGIPGCNNNKFCKEIRSM